MGLREYIIRRLILFIFVLLGVAVLVFSIIQLIPAEQRIILYVTNPQHLTGSEIEKVIAKYHLRDPPIIQFFYWLDNILHGNFGLSRISHEPVLDAILSRWPATIEVVMFTFPPIVLVGVYLGIISAVHRDKPVDHAVRLFSLVGWALPTFWFALILIAIFAGWLHWLPAPSPRGRLSPELYNQVVLGIGGQKIKLYTGIYTIDGILNGRLDVVADTIIHLILPIITLTVVSVAGLARVMRSSMLEALMKGYTVTARAKGLKFKDVINKHVRRNALIPVVTLSALYVAGMLNGLVITETVFRIGGLGRWAYESAYQTDQAAIVAFSLFAATMFVIANLIADILYAYIDPRIRLG